MYHPKPPENKKLEKRVVKFFKPLVYFYLSSQNVPFVLVGAGALELQLERPDTANTLDADIHTWSNFDILNNFTKEQKDSYTLDIAKKLERYFESDDFKKQNKATLDYFKGFIPGNIKYAEALFIITASRLKIFGYDIADIVYDKHDPSTYFEAGKFGNGSVGIKILRIPNYIDAQILVLENTKQYFDRSHRHLLKLDWLASVLSVMSVDSFFDKYYRPNLDILREKDRKFWSSKILKTLNRIKLATDIFYDKASHTFNFKKGGSSCITLSYAVRNSPKIEWSKTLYAEHSDVNYCVSKTIFGGGNSINLNLNFTSNIPGVFGPYTYASLNIYRDKLNEYLLRNCSLRFTSSCYPDALIGDPNSVENALCRWSWKSTDITNACRTFYIDKAFGIPFPFDNNLLSLTQRIQMGCATDLVLPFDMYVFKTARSIVFSKDKTNQEFEKGDKIFQYFFNSTSIDRQAELLHFANFETGTAGYVIKLPQGSKVFYFGMKPPGVAGNERSAYPTEYEILLPIGCVLEVKNVIEDGYISSGGSSRPMFYKMKIYEMLYHPPSDDIFPYFEPSNIKPPTNLVTLYGSQQNLASIANNSNILPGPPNPLLGNNISPEISDLDFALNGDDMRLLMYVLGRGFSYLSYSCINIGGWIRYLITKIINVIIIPACNKSLNYGLELLLYLIDRLQDTWIPFLWEATKSLLGIIWIIIKLSISGMITLIKALYVALKNNHKLRSLEELRDLRMNF